jgi:hypothetical protein
MTKTRRIRKIRKVRRTSKLKKTRRGGGSSCYKTNKNGNIIRTWSCSAKCEENGACGPYD